MDNFLIRWLNELRDIPAAAPDKNFSKDFPAASGLEWHLLDEGFEARFMLEGKEMTARYSSRGKLQEYRTNMPRDPLPDTISKMQNQWGEVMSLISISKMTTKYFEIVFRKPDHTRYLVITDENGEVVDKPRVISPENYPEILPEN
jgi:hypothetical protein